MLQQSPKEILREYGVLPVPANASVRFLQSAGGDQLSLARAELLKSCGPVCNMDTKGVQGKYFDFVKKTIDCKAIFSPVPQSLTMHPPPLDPPADLQKDYSMPGKQEISNQRKSYHRNDLHTDDQMKGTWSKAMIDAEVKIISEQRYVDMTTVVTKKGLAKKGGYGESETKKLHEFFEKHRAEIQGHHCAVVGSQTPWIEALLLQVGAAKITTIEYGTIKSEHEQITTMHPFELPEMVNRQN